MIFKSVKVILGITVIMLIVILVMIIKFGSDIEGWDVFKKDIKSEYDYIDYIIVRGYQPALWIDFSLIEEPNEKDAIEIFERTRKFIENEKVFLDLQSVHKKRYKGGFGRVNIRFFDRREKNKIIYDFFSENSEGGIPKYDSFKRWFIEYNNKGAKEYKPN